MSSELKEMLATLRSNGAICSLKLASSASRHAALLLYDAVCRDCSSVLDGLMFGPGDVPKKVLEKLKNNRETAIEKRHVLLQQGPTKPPPNEMVELQLMQVVKGGSLDVASNGSVCTMCLEAWAGPLEHHYVAVLSCGHAHCSRCLVDWHTTCNDPRSKTKCACPLCRTPIVESIVDELVSSVAAKEEHLQLLATHISEAEAQQQ
eukprot:1215657-Prymnesium_polylepis.1